MAGPSLAQIPSVPKALGIASKDQADEARQMQELYRTLGTNLAEQAVSAGKGTIGNSLETPETIKLKDTEQLKADLLKSNAAAAAGMSPDTSVNVMDIMLRDIRDTGLEMRKVADGIAKDKAVSLFDDPLQAIANAFTIPWDEQHLKGLSEKQANSKKTLDDLTSGVTNTAATAEAVRAKIDAAGIVDRQRAISEDMLNQSRAISAKGIESNIHGVQAAMVATDRTLKLSIEYNNYLHTEESRRLIKAQRELVIEQKTAAIKATKDVALAEAEQLRFYNVAAQKEGLPLIASTGQLKSRIVTQKEKERIDDMINRGMLLDNPDSFTARTYSQGDTVGQILAFRARNGIRAKTPDEQTIISAMQEAKLKGDELEKTPEARDLKATELFKKWFAEHEIVKRDDNTNPMRAPAFETMALAPTVQANPVFQKVIAPLITDGNRKQSAHPDIVGEMVAKAVTDRKISANEATDFLQKFYIQAALINNENVQIQKITGLRQSKFKASVDAGVSGPAALTGIGVMVGGIAATPFMPIVGGGITLTGAGMAGTAAFMTKKEYDFMDKTEVQAWLTRKVYANFQKFGQSQEVSGAIK